MEVTDKPDLVRESLRISAPAWKGPLSEEKYEQLVTEKFQTVTNRWFERRFWALLRREQDSWRVVSACETFRRPAYRKEFGKPGEFVSDVVLASVFTREDVRKSGYAAQMVNYVVRAMEDEQRQSEGKEGAIAMISLWSDVGDYYSRFGFRKVLSRSIVCDPTEQMVAGARNWPSAEKLSLEKAGQLFKQLQKEMIDQMEEDCEVDGRGRILIVPDAGLYDLNVCTMRMQVATLKIDIPPVMGARTMNAHGWALWTYDFGRKCLYIVAAFGSADEIALLYQCACVMAAQYQLKVVLYEGSIVGTEVEELVAALEARGSPAQLVERTESLAMYKGTDCVWAFPGRYAWY